MNLQIWFGIVLREQRKKLSITQDELAHRSNLDRTFVGLLERGQRKPSLDTIFALSRGLEIRPSELIAEVEKRYRLNPSL